MALDVPPDMFDYEEYAVLRFTKEHQMDMNRVGKMFDRTVVIVVTLGLIFMLLTVIAAVFLLARTLMMSTDAASDQMTVFDTNATDNGRFDAHRTVMVISKARKLLASPISIGFLRHRQHAPHSEKTHDLFN